MYKYILHPDAVLDLCDGVACVNGGICSGGICACPLGYYGLLCESKYFFKQKIFYHKSSIK